MIGTMVLTLNSTLIIRNKNTSSTKKVVEEVSELLNANENLEQVESSLKE